LTITTFRILWVKILKVLRIKRFQKYHMLKLKNNTR